MTRFPILTVVVILASKVASLAFGKAYPVAPTHAVNDANPG